MKRALVLASVASMIDQFNMPNIRLLIELGYEVDVACNFIEGNTCSDERVAILKQSLKKLGVNCYQVDFARNVFRFGQNLRALRQVRHLLDERNYSLIHGHSPIGGLLSRIAARNIRQKGTKVIYTAHGFHFFQGAPIQNWLLFYPIEKVASRWTDVLITITHEDYELAVERMKAKEVVYVPGVGVDTSSFNPSGDATIIRKTKREELGVEENILMMLSVGELNKNKNHEVIFRAIASLPNRNTHYYIAGRGELKEYLEQLAKELGISEQVHLLGFRNDVRDLYKAADVFVHPSFREGLSVAVMEAMASGLPVVCSKIRGNTDLIDQNKGGYLFSPGSIEDAKTAIQSIIANDNLDTLGAYNVRKAEGFDVKKVMETMRIVYTDCPENNSLRY